MAIIVTEITHTFKSTSNSE